jgi:hypothetical protein
MKTYEFFLQKIYYFRKYDLSETYFKKHYEEFSLTDRVTTLLALLPWLEDKDESAVQLKNTIFQKFASEGFNLESACSESPEACAEQYIRQRLEALAAQAFFDDSTRLDLLSLLKVLEAEVDREAKKEKRFKQGTRESDQQAVQAAQAQAVLWKDLVFKITTCLVNDSDKRLPAEPWQYGAKLKSSLIVLFGGGLSALGLLADAEVFEFPAFFQEMMRGAGGALSISPGLAMLLFVGLPCLVGAYCCYRNLSDQSLKNRQSVDKEHSINTRIQNVLKSSAINTDASPTEEARSADLTDASASQLASNSLSMAT